MEKNTVKNIRFRYVIGLSAIALLITASFITMQKVVAEQRDFSTIVNLAGHQAGLSNRIAYFASLMVTTDNESEFDMAKAQVGRTINKMKRAHEILMYGDPEEGIPRITNENLQTIYNDPMVGLDRALKRFLRRAGTVYNSDMASLHTGSAAYLFLTTYGPHVLEPMFDAAVDEYQKIGKKAIVRIERFEIGIWLATIVTLLLEVCLIFYPLERNIRHTLKSLQNYIHTLTSTRKRLLAAQKLASVGDWELQVQNGRLSSSDRLTWSDQVYEICGVSPGTFDVSLENSLELIHPEDRPKVRSLLLKCMAEKATAHMEFRICRPDGTERLVYQQAEMRQPGTSNGEEPVLSGIIQDISEWKRAEEEKQRAHQLALDREKHALIGQIAGKMAHDFNNVLGAIMGNTELGLLDCKDEKIAKILKLIFEQSIRGKNLTKNLVAFARDQEPKQDFFRVNEKIDLVLNLLKKDLGVITVEREYQATGPELLADPGMIEHALLNLLQNSIHATSMAENPKIIIRTFHNDLNIFIEIEDNGCGIPDEYIERIYEPAFTLKGSRDIKGAYKSDIKGTGYGMSNVKKYVEQHKGLISIDSEVGTGTKITISLPVIRKELSQEEKSEIQNQITHFEKSILLVEDEMAISDVQYRILTQPPCSHKVDIAPDGRIAVDLLERNEYDFVSLDYVLPGKINGIDIYHHIRERDKTLPILFISGNLEFLESITELKRGDFYIDHLSKPCSNQDYIHSINNLLTCVEHGLETEMLISPVSG